MGNRKDMAEGSLTASGSAVSVLCGFKPKAVLIVNSTDERQLFWSDAMGDGKGWKQFGTSSGTAAAQTFTPSATAGDLNLATPAFSGTGLTAAGQVITTTSNHTMTLNQCAGMWLISATGATPPNLILSNTAVTAAPAVLTVQGAASTDAGAYKIVRVTTTGTNGTSSVTGGAGEAAFVSTNGITPLFNGFTFGADTDINVNLSTIYWTAWK